MTVGRFQPFTLGHLNMINEGEGPCIVYRINSSDKTIERKRKGIKIGSKSYNDECVNNVISYIDNPIGDLGDKEKELLKRPFTNELIDKEFDIVKKSNKNIVDIIPVVNMFEALARFNKFILDNQDEYEPGLWMCGDDRVDIYSEYINKYDKLAITRGGEEYDNVLKGKLKTSTGKGRTEGVSGTEVRKSILNKDKSAFERIMPKGTGVMFNDFIKAFDDFKQQLQNIIKEHKMISLKEYIYESKINKKINMKTLTEYINESVSNNIFEGFLDTLKKAIKKVVGDPQEYIDDVKSQIEELKKKEYWMYQDKKDIDAVAKELDALNNDESLKKIYEYVKTIFKGKDQELKFALLGDAGSWPMIFKDVEETFNTDENKTFAIVQIANAIALATKDKFNVQTASEYYTNYHTKDTKHSHSSKSSNAGMIAAAVGASIAMHN